MLKTNKINHRFPLLITLVFFAGIAFPKFADASVINVNNQCSIVDAVISAETNQSFGGCLAGSGQDTIILSQDVTVSSEYNATGNAFPVISESLVVDLGGHTLTHQNISPNPVRLFKVLSSTLTLKNGSIIFSSTNSPIPQNGGVVFSTASNLRFSSINIEGFGSIEKGGVAYVDGGSLIVRSSVFYENGANDGGVFYVENAPVNFVSSKFLNNDAVNEGGVLLTFGQTNVNISQSYFDMNKAYYGGALNLGLAGDDDFFTIKTTQFEHNYTNIGGIVSLRGYNHQTTVDQSSFYDNKAFDVGSVIGNDNTGSITIVNTSFGQNESFGGPSAIFETTTGSSYKIAYSTFAHNNSNVGMGAFGAPYSSVSNSFLENSIFENNTGGDCIMNTFNGLTLLSNLSDDGTCGQSLASGIGSIGFYGGTTKLYQLLSNSNAIDNAVIIGSQIPCPRFDQRGRVRPVDGNGDGNPVCDIGAFEGNRKMIYLEKETALRK